mgnify:CR=1 FL=1
MLFAKLNTRDFLIKRENQIFGKNLFLQNDVTPDSSRFIVF